MREGRTEAEERAAWERASVPRELRGFRRLTYYLKKSWLRASIGLLLVPIFTAVQLYIPRVWGDSMQALERMDLAASGAAESSSTIDASWWIWRIAFLACLWLAYSSLRCLARYLQVGLSRRIEEELRDDLFRHLQRLPARFFDEARIGDLVSRITTDVELLRFMAGPTLFFGLQTLIVLPGTLWFLGQISGVLVMTVVILFALIALGLQFAFPRLAKTSRVVQDAQADIAAKAQEDFAGVRVLHGFARERAEVTNFAALAEDCRKAQIEMARARGLLHASFVVGGQIAPLAIVIIGIVEGMSVSRLFEAFLYMQMLVWPLMVTGWLLQSWHRARAAADRIDEIFDVAPEDEGEPQEEVDMPRFPSIEASGLSFRYGEGANALEDVSFEIPSRGVLGIVGPIGSGKSTLIALLTRLYEPPRGALFVGGHDVTRIPRRQLRTLFSIATQDPFLFSDTLENNIRFGRSHESSDAEELERALEDASLKIDPEIFSQGLQQLVGERGVSLSGGQKQRASLARALLARRDVLVLDDTLSAVDAATEQRILASLRVRARSQTTILVAHRLDAVQAADKILVLDEGRLVDQGTHEELLERGAWYAQTWAQQQRERAS